MVGQIMTTDTETDATETLLQVVANPQRRTILHHLVRVGAEDVGVDDLTKTIVTDGGTATDPGGDQDMLRRAKIELHHRHLPKLADADLIEYDTEARTVRYHPTDGVESLLEVIKAQLE